MKKLITMLMILTLWAGISLQASKPIPSYNVNISSTANFQEKDRNKNDPNSGEKGKRYMIVVTNVAGPSKLPIIVWVYSLDGRDIQGPFTLYGNDEISVPIDDRDWGTIMQTTEKSTVSVWTSDDPAGDNTDSPAEL